MGMIGADTVKHCEKCERCVSVPAGLHASNQQERSCSRGLPSEVTVLSKMKIVFFGLLEN